MRHSRIGVGNTAFSKVALVREIVLSLIRLRTVSTYETDFIEKQGKSHVF